MSSAPSNLCVCGQCQPQWFLNAWVCPFRYRRQQTQRWLEPDPWARASWNRRNERGEREDAWNERSEREESWRARGVGERNAGSSMWPNRDNGGWGEERTLTWQEDRPYRDRRPYNRRRGGQVPPGLDHRQPMPFTGWETGRGREFLEHDRSVSPQWPEAWTTEEDPWLQGADPWAEEDPWLREDPWAAGRNDWGVLGPLLHAHRHFDFPDGLFAGLRLPIRVGYLGGSDSEDDDPDFLRALQESLRTAEAEEQTRLEQDRDTQIRLVGHCVVCFEAKQGGAACSHGAATSLSDHRPATHFVCGECLPMYVESELRSDEQSDRRLMERRAFGHCLKCPCSPMPMDCGGFVEERHVRPFLSNTLWSQLQAASQADEKHRQWQKESRDNEDPEFLREALLRSMPNAVQCGRCQYGPIDHAGCDDLDAHHWQWQGSSQIQNQCPKCGWWAHNIDSWPSWDGVIRQ